MTLLVFHILRWNCIRRNHDYIVTRPEMAKIWSDENRYNCWLEVEILADEAWAELGEIPQRRREDS